HHHPGRRTHTAGPHHRTVQAVTPWSGWRLFQCRTTHATTSRNHQRETRTPRHARRLGGTRQRGTSRSSTLRPHRSLNADLARVRGEGRPSSRTRSRTRLSRRTHRSHKGTRKSLLAEGFSSAFVTSVSSSRKS